MYIFLTSNGCNFGLKDPIFNLKSAQKALHGSKQNRKMIFAAKLAFFSKVSHINFIYPCSVYSPVFCAQFVYKRANC